MKNKRFFTKHLLDWNREENTRKMPWKGEKEPYKIWISEIILQQTRVKQGLHYYERFIKQFPDIKSLSEADEKEVYKLWEGLGYYTRCKNLMVTAKIIQTQHGGVFPEKFEEILSLKGIGNYTAAAIASFAFNKPHAVLDGNVFRVLSRFFGIEMPVNSPKAKNYYAELAESLLDRDQPASYNQAIMDFGAEICKPQQPLCEKCPLHKKCIAYLENKTGQLPVKIAANKQKKRFFIYAIIEYRNKIYVRKRKEKDIWQNLYEFFLIEKKGLEENFNMIADLERELQIPQKGYSVLSISDALSQKLTHQIITGRFIHIRIKKPLIREGYFPVNETDLQSLPFPKLIADYLSRNPVPLN